MTPSAGSAMKSAVVAVAWTLCVVGCGSAGAGGGDDGDGEVVVTAQGTGEANAEPLWPAKPGWLLQRDASGGVTDSLLEERLVDGKSVMPLGNGSRLGPNLTGAPSEPACTRYLAADDEGIWFYGGPREGLLESGALIIPAEVRVGMKWESHVGGRLRFSGEVVGRTVEETKFGVRPVWELELTDERAWTYDGLDWTFAQRRLGTVWELRLVEGRGPDAPNMLTSCRTWDGPEDLGQGAAYSDTSFIVVPLEGDETAPLAPPIVELSPVSETALADDYLPWEAGSYPDPEAPSGRVIAMRGKFEFFGQYMIGDAEAGFSAGGGWSDVPEMRCAHWHGTEVTPFRSDEVCTTPDGVVVTEAGTFAALPVLWEGSPVQYNVCWGDCGQLVFHEFTGIWQGLDGSPWAVAWGDGATLNVGRYEQGFLVESTRAFLDNEFSVLPGYAPLLSARTSQMVWPAVNADGTISLAEYSNDHRGPLGRTAFVRTGLDGGLDASHFAYPATEIASTVVERGERSHYVFSQDGLLRRVHVGGNDLQIEPIAQLRLPNDDMLTAAFVDGGEIVALSQRGFLGYDPWYGEDGYAPTRRPELGDVYLWRGALPPASAPQRPSPIFGVEAKVVDQDVRVCWPPGHGTVDTSSFTLAGKPPALAMDLGECVLLVRHATTVEALLQPGAWAVEGVLPGAGKVAIALGASMWRNQLHGDGFEYGFGLTEAAPVAGGGFVAPTMLYGPGLVRPKPKYGVDDSGYAVADLSGLGMWLYRPRWMEHSISLFGPHGETRIDLEPWVAPRYPIPVGGCHPTCAYDLSPIPLLGGGVLIGTLRISPDGTVSELAEAWRDEDGGMFRATAGTADGSYCGIRPHGEEVCVSAGGAEAAPPLSLALGGVLSTPMQTENAIWTFSSDPQGHVAMVRLDRRDLSLSEFDTPVDATQLQSDAKGLKATYVRYDSQGQLYVLFNTPAGHWLWRIDDDAPTPIELAELSLYLPDQTLSFLVDEDLFVFASSIRYAAYELEYLGLLEQQGVIRVPRAGR